MGVTSNNEEREKRENYVSQTWNDSTLDIKMNSIQSFIFFFFAADQLHPDFIFRV